MGNKFQNGENQEMNCSLHKRFDSFLERFNDHSEMFRDNLKDQETLAIDLQESFKKVDAMKTMLHAVETSTKGLGSLPIIANEIKIMRWGLLIMLGTICFVLILKEIANRTIDVQSPTHWKISPEQHDSTISKDDNGDNQH